MAYEDVYIYVWASVLYTDGQCESTDSLLVCVPPTCLHSTVLLNIPSVRARFAWGYLEELINTLLSFAAGSKQLINALPRPLRKHAAINIRFAHDFAQALDKLNKELAHALCSSSYAIKLRLPPLLGN